MQKRVLGLSIAILLVLFLAIGGTTATQAQQSAGLSVGLQVNADGSWQVVELFGQSTNLNPQSFNSMAQLLGLGFEVPSTLMDPAFVSMFQQAGVNQLTLSLEGDAARVRLNDWQTPQVKVHLASLNVLLGDSFSQSYGFLMEILKFVQGRVFVRFTPEAVQAAAPAEAGAGDAANAIHLAATVNSQGEVLSAGGFTRQDVDALLGAGGLVIPKLDPSVMAYLAAFDSVSVGVSPSAVTVSADEAPVVEVIWDEQGRAATLDLVGALTGMTLPPDMVEMAEPWIQSTAADVTVYVANEPMDDLLSVEIGEPIQVALGDDGMLHVAGMALPLAGVDTGLLQNTVSAYGVDQAQLCWEGTELRWLVNGMPMPYVTADAGWFTKVTRLLGWQVFPLHEKVEQLLANTELPLAVSLDPANVPAGGCGDYQAAMAEGAPSLAFALEGTWDRQQNELDLENVDLPFGMLGLLPIGISMQLDMPDMVGMFVPSGVNSVEASLGPSGLMATLDDVNVGLHWDSQLLSNLAEVADGFGAGATIRQVAPVLNMAEINVDLETIEAMTASE